MFPWKRELQFAFVEDKVKIQKLQLSGIKKIAADMLIAKIAVVCELF